MINVGLRYSIEHIVAVVQFRADDGARDSVHRILVDERGMWFQRSPVIIASANNITDVLANRQVAVNSYAEYA